MGKQNKNTQYLILFLGLFFGVVSFFAFFNLPHLRIPATIGFCLFYFLWGITHHWLIKDLHIRIVLEYFLISLFACLVLISVIIRG